MILTLITKWMKDIRTKLSYWMSLEENNYLLIDNLCKLAILRIEFRENVSCCCRPRKVQVVWGMKDKIINMFRAKAE